jgi:hypothetical protein
MAMSAQELFDSRVPSTLARDPGKAREIGAVYLFKISGEGGGEWTVDLASPAPSCKPGSPGQRTVDCTIEIAHEDFKAMVGKPALAMQFYFQGKMKVSGDPMLATKLQKLLSMGG